MSYEETQATEWNALYDELLGILGRYGANDAFGKGDFFLVDDNYSSPQHKVCVTKLSFLTRPVATDVQRAVRRFSLPWEVIFSLEMEDHRYKGTGEGIVVRKADVLELWDKKQLSAAFGEDFKWNISAIAT